MYLNLKKKKKSVSLLSLAHFVDKKKKQEEMTNIPLIRLYFLKDFFFVRKIFEKYFLRGEAVVELL